MGKLINGFSLSELLVSLVLSSLLITAGIQTLLFIKKQNLAQQRNLQTLLEFELITRFFFRSIDQAGFTPCINLEKISTYKGLEVAPNAITVRHMSENFSQVIQESNQQLMIVDNLSISPIEGHSVLISDCFHAEVAKVSKIINQNFKKTVFLSAPLRFKYGDAAYLGEWVVERFYMNFDNDKPRFYYCNKHPEQLSRRVKNIEFIREKEYLKVHWKLTELLSMTQRLALTNL